jgi:hypothetical protein
MVFALLRFALAGFTLVADAHSEPRSPEPRLTRLERDRSAR